MDFPFLIMYIILDQKTSLHNITPFQKGDMFEEFRCFNCQLPLLDPYFDVRNCWTGPLVLEMIFHHHLDIKAMLKDWISNTPSLPSSLVLHTCPQETRLLPPLPRPAPKRGPSQRNLLRMWLISFLTNELLEINIIQKGKKIYIDNVRDIEENRINMFLLYIPVYCKQSISIVLILLFNFLKIMRSNSYGLLKPNFSNFSFDLAQVDRIINNFQ